MTLKNGFEDGISMPRQTIVLFFFFTKIVFKCFARNFVPTVLLSQPVYLYLYGSIPNNNNSDMYKKAESVWDAICRSGSLQSIACLHTSLGRGKLCTIFNYLLTNVLSSHLKRFVFISFSHCLVHACGSRVCKCARVHQTSDPNDKYANVYRVCGFEAEIAMPDLQEGKWEKTKQNNNNNNEKIINHFLFAFTYLKMKINNFSCLSSQYESGLCACVCCLMRCEWEQAMHDPLRSTNTLLAPDTPCGYMRLSASARTRMQTSE